jgi:lysophospholipase L1-like esterase
VAISTFAAIPSSAGVNASEPNWALPQRGLAAWLGSSAILLLPGQLGALTVAGLGVCFAAATITATTLLGAALRGSTSTPTPVLRFAALGSASALVLAAFGRPLGLAAVLLVAAALAVSFPRQAGAAITKVFPTVRRLVGAVLGIPLFAVLGSATLIPAWTIHGSGPDERASGWLPAQRRPSRRHRPIRILAVLAAVGLGTFIVARLSDRSGPPNAAFADAPWWPQLQAETGWAMFDPGVAFNPLRFPPHRDVTGRYLNITDGYRQSWTPPACDCRRVRLWLYGGSTTFGMGQRDEHTIASELARLAWADGIALDVSNRGVLGDLSWEETERFSWEVQSQDPPDLVVFYDGYNEVEAALQRLRTGTLDEYPVDWGAETALGADSTLARAWRWALGARRPDSIRLADPPQPSPQPVSVEDTDGLADHIQGQYNTARAMATGAAEGIGVYWFWQPVSNTSPAIASAEPPPPADDPRTRLFNELERTLDGEVHDLSKAFASVDQPVFFDAVHTNELGARLVAEAMYAELRPELLTLADSATG